MYRFVVIAFAAACAPNEGAPRPNTPSEAIAAPAEAQPPHSLVEGLRWLGDTDGAEAGVAFTEPSERRRVPVAVAWDDDALTWVAGVRAVHWQPAGDEVALQDVGYVWEHSPLALARVGVGLSHVAYWTGSEQSGLGLTVWRPVSKRTGASLQRTIDRLACGRAYCVATSYDAPGEKHGGPAVVVVAPWRIDHAGRTTFDEETTVPSPALQRIAHVAVGEEHWYASSSSTLYIGALGGDVPIRERIVDEPIEGLDVVPEGVVILTRHGLEVRDPITTAVVRAVPLERPVLERLPVGAEHLAISEDGRLAAVAFARFAHPASQGVEIVHIESGKRCPFAEGTRVDALTFGGMSQLVTASHERVQLWRHPPCEP